MRWRQFLAAGTIAFTAFSASGKWNMAHAAVAYYGSDQCDVNEPDDDGSYCESNDTVDGGSGYDNGSNGSGDGYGYDSGYDTATKVCGKYYAKTCPGTNTTTVFKHVCTKWQLTQLNGEVTFVRTAPVVGLGGTTTCAEYTDTTESITQPNRWDK